MELGIEIWEFSRVIKAIGLDKKITQRISVNREFTRSQGGFWSPSTFRNQEKWKESAKKMEEKQPLW